MDIRDNDPVVGADVLVDVSLDISGIHVNILTDICGDISPNVEGDIQVDHARHSRPQDETILVHQDVGKTKRAC